MGLVLHMDSRCIFYEYNHWLKDDSLEYRSGDNAIYYTLHIGKCNSGSKMENFFILIGKKIVWGCDIKDSGIWPYNTKKEYLDFLIGLDKNEIKYTSDSNKLSNYFGVNPEVYKIKDDIIRCVILLPLYIDN